jgi:hypothetical protein
MQNDNTQSNGARASSPPNGNAQDAIQANGAPRNGAAALPSPAAIAGAGDGEIIAGEIILPSVPVDDLLDDHATELEEIRRWASTETGQASRMENPLGFANVRAHAAAHERALVAQQQSAAIANASAAPARNKTKSR